MMWNFNGINLYLLGFIALIIIAILVANDATANGRNGLLWGLVALMPMGLIIYLIVRTLPVNTYQPVRTAPRYQPVPTAAPSQVVVNSAVTKDAQFCTSCGSSNKLEATFCNTCGAKILQE